jgi:hypothetical protein
MRPAESDHDGLRRNSMSMEANFPHTGCLLRQANWLPACSAAGATLFAEGVVRRYDVALPLSSLNHHRRAACLNFSYICTLQNPRLLIYPILPSSLPDTGLYTPSTAMKFSLASTLVVAFAAQGVIANTWFGKPGAYRMPYILFPLPSPCLLACSKMSLHNTLKQLSCVHTEIWQQHRSTMRDTFPAFRLRYKPHKTVR